MPNPPQTPKRRQHARSTLQGGTASTRKQNLRPDQQASQRTSFLTESDVLALLQRRLREYLFSAEHYRLSGMLKEASTLDKYVEHTRALIRMSQAVERRPISEADIPPSMGVEVPDDFNPVDDMLAVSSPTTSPMAFHRRQTRCLESPGGLHEFSRGICSNCGIAFSENNSRINPADLSQVLEHVENLLFKIPNLPIANGFHLAT